MSAEAAPAAPPESRHPLVAKILAADAPKPIRLTAARGALPLPAHDLLYIQICLLRDSDPEVAGEARATLDKQTSESLLSLFKDPACDPLVLDHFIRHGRVTGRSLEIAIAHPSTPDPALEHLAMGENAETLSLIVTNEVRVISNPRLLALLRDNPKLSPDNRRRLDELERDYVGRKYEKVREAPAPEPAAAPEPEEPLPEVPPEEDVPLDLPDIESIFEEDLRNTPAFQKIMKLNVSERLNLAMKGSAEERAILIRDTARMVAMQVLKSPKLGEQEVCSFANMRNVSEDVLRTIGSHREWTKKYAVAHALVRNPKTPPGISLPFLARLGTRDLKIIQGDKNVPEILRRQARNILLARTQPPKKLLGKKSH